MSIPLAIAWIVIRIIAFLVAADLLARAIKHTFGDPS